MKKNKMMRLASVLLVAVLMSTCAISGTFAKYVTKGTATSTARVAKFGVEVSATGDLFSTTYEVHDTNADQTKITSNSVISTDKVVAPGTSGELTGSSIKGTPEVAVRVTNEATVTLDDNWIVDGAFYCPIEITVNGVKVDTSTCTDKDTFATAVANAINAVSAEYKAGTDLSNVTDGLSISWAWPFYVDEATDKKDTALGDAAAGIPDGAQAATISINVTTTVTQID